MRNQALSSADLHPGRKLQAPLIAQLVLASKDPFSCQFLREKTCGFRWCSRQISNMLLTPVSSSSTNRALHPGLNARRLAIVLPLSWTD
ncbi:hypothetical protein ACFLTC_01950 [Chloroflexota bacterium]